MDRHSNPDESENINSNSKQEELTTSGGGGNTNNSDEEYEEEDEIKRSSRGGAKRNIKGVQSSRAAAAAATSSSSQHSNRPKSINTKSRVTTTTSRHQASSPAGDNENNEEEEDLEGEENDETSPLSPTFSSPRSHHYQSSRSATGGGGGGLNHTHQTSFKMQQRSNTMTSSGGSVKYPNHGNMNNNNSINAQKMGDNSYSGMKPQSSMNMQKQQATSGFHPSNYYEDKIDVWGHLLIGISYFFLVFSFPFSLCACLKVAQEYERAVIFRLGRILKGGAKGPGIFFVLPCIDTYTKVDLRTVTFDVPPQEILTKDSVTVSVDAVVYFRIFNAVISVINVEDAAKSTKLLAASTLRNILGTKSLHEILSDRESVAILIQNNLDEATGPWGVKVERVEVKDVRLPVQLQRAMATEAEAAREARAKVIAAEGEQKASKALKEAAEVISESPIAIQLRYLQTLTAIASEKNSTIVFPIPLEMLSFLANKAAGMFKIKT